MVFPPELIRERIQRIIAKNAVKLRNDKKAFSCDEDFNPNKALNYPKMDHDKKWNHTRAKMKIEATADIHILVENLLESSSEQERKIISLLFEGYN